ncbi:MAG: hypothetical protein JSU86_10220 [Phycisphaerales bacterium]|nr:MAG: hypothetical protein JSU86_10220 [Phycisphaerales bacterium]
MRYVRFAIALAALLRPSSGLSEDRVEDLVSLKAQSFNLGELLTIRSDVLNEDRKVLIRLPDDYDASARKKYPVLYVLDAEYHFQLTVAAVQFLSECAYNKNAHSMPAMIIVGIVNEDRNRDYTPTYAPKHRHLRFPTSGKSALFREFLETELMPLVDARYRTEPFRVLTGWSFGGLFTVHTLLTKPDLFGGYLAVSPSLWWDDQYVVKQANEMLTDGVTIQKRLVVTLGADEGGDMGSSVADSFVPLLRRNNVSELVFQYLTIADENHDFVIFKATLHGLKALFSDWYPPDDVVTAGLRSVQEFYDNLSQKTGCRVDVPQSVYNRVAQAMRNNGQMDAAIDTFKLSLKRHPASSYTLVLLGSTYYQSNKLKEAKDCYERAYNIESERAVHYSEDLNDYRRLIKQVQAKLDRRAKSD